MAWTAPRTWQTGETVTASLMNVHVKDNLDYLKARTDVADALGTWQDYTPTWTALGSAPSIGNGTLSGRYCQIRSVVHFKLYLRIGSTTNLGSSSWVFGVPISATYSTSDIAVFHAVGSDSSTGLRLGGAWLDSASTFRINGTDTPNNWGATVPHTWASTDYLHVSGTYEAA